MLTPGPLTKIDLAAGATDLRAGFEKLTILAQALFAQSPTCGHYFLFCNASRTRLKVLCWDGHGLWLCLILEEYRRLEALARFSSKSDKIAALSPNIQELFAAEPGLSEVEVDAAPDQTAAQTEAEAASLEKLVKQKRYKTKPHPGRAVFPPQLPRVEIMVDQAPAPLADGTLPIVFLREVTERLNVTPASYFVERTTIVSYRFPNQPGAGIHRGPAPAALIFKSSLAPALVIEFIIHKYADHAPLYRQVPALERDHGIVLSYPTVDRHVITTAALAIPLADAVLAELTADQYLQPDEPTTGRQAAIFYMN